MARWHPKHCRVEGCTAAADEISARGYCLKHAQQRENANREQIVSGEGPFYDHWVYQWSLAARRRLVALNQKG